MIQAQASKRLVEKEEPESVIVSRFEKVFEVAEAIWTRPGNGEKRMGKIILAYAINLSYNNI